MSIASRLPPKYDVKSMVSVYINDREYFVDLEDETVVTATRGRYGYLQYRRVTSRRIETSAILRAADKRSFEQDEQFLAAIDPCGK